MNESSSVYCESVEFTYEQNTQPTLRGVDCEIERGSFTVIAGPSGAGKSTFCRTLNNIIPVFLRGKFSGKRRIAGEWLEKQAIAQLAQKVGMVFQDFEQQLFSTSVLLDLSFAPENFGVPEKEMESRMHHLLEVFGMLHLAGREPSSLSGGEKQKLAIASVLSYKPEILVLDEPTTDLDPDSRELVLETLPRLRDWVDTLIVIDHETEQFQSADHLFLLNEGRIRESGKLEALLIRSEALIENSLAPLDLVRVQESIGIPPSLISAEDLASKLAGRALTRIPGESRTTNRPVVEVQDVSYRYEGQTTNALDQVSFEIREGEFAAIIGRNGSGKSTLLKHLNGLQLPQQGTVKILGRNVREWKRRELARAAGLVFQNPDHQIFESTVKSEIEFGPKQFQFDEKQIRENVSHVMEIMGLQEQADRDPFQLSKGERQRVAVASVLSVQPEILILDEPTTGLDDQQQRYLMELLRDLNRNGKTVVIVTHSLRLVAAYCNHAIVLSQGQKVAEGHPRDVLFSSGIKLPPLLQLSKIMNGNALSVQEFVDNLSPRSS